MRSRTLTLWKETGGGKNKYKSRGKESGRGTWHKMVGGGGARERDRERDRERQREIAGQLERELEIGREHV